MGLLAGVFVVWGLIVSVFAPFAPGGLAKITVFAIGWAPTAALVWFAMDRSKRRKAAHKKMLDDIGVTPGRGFDHSENGTGIAINRDQRVVGVLSGGAYRTYGYEKLREWTIREERAGSVTPAFGVANGVMAAGANARMARDARANTGLFLTFRDLDCPTWRVAMRDLRTRERWMELLRQEVNERAAEA
ncbi:hypothetical protein SRABI118_02414 [Massilia sp. Bi118]|uniref:DUF4755 domain-containing protein n=1 Tax=Massilia sp. Bi118 TaxID=2822346 RepID=UPI001D24EF3B|nr:DUF4755 domain-containing protein [Massilia sp. Bi118]CAH0228844.1 hypothetical protein SRABI118_02414 [Massilia sp. Bi118]